jgi:subtilisin family serine protease
MHRPIRTPALVVGMLAALSAGCADQPTAPAAPADAPALSQGGDGRAIPDRYIVVLKAGASARGLAREAGSTPGAAVHFVYEHALNGFAATLPPQAVEALRRNPQVDFIEPDRAATLHATQASPPSWGLDRVDQRNLPLNQAYNYYYTGAGVHVYVIDSGIRSTHQEFTGRMGTGWSYVADGNGAEDCNGHGTHVAGTIGGSTYGVAKGVTLHSIRVADCFKNTSFSQIVAGVDGVKANAVKPAVANLSAGAIFNPWNASHSITMAVQSAVASGITFVVSAGNDGQDACTYTPALVAEAITVGAVNQSDQRSVWNSSQSSNYGSCLDVFAPGTSIVSAGITSDAASRTDSGTSFAAPHVAGAAALILQANPTATPATVQSTIIANATANKVQNAGSNSPNRLLFTLQRLQVTFTGPTYINATGTYGWSVSATGGEVPGVYAYNWDMTEYDHCGNSWYSPGVSSTSSYSRGVARYSPDFTLFATVTSGTETLGQSRSVNLDFPLMACPE